MNLLMRMLYKWQKRKMCKCTSPRYEVIDKMIYCMNCHKPIHKLDMEIC